MIPITMKSQISLSVMFKVLVQLQFEGNDRNTPFKLRLWQFFRNSRAGSGMPSKKPASTRFSADCRNSEAIGAAADLPYRGATHNHSIEAGDSRVDFCHRSAWVTAGNAYAKPILPPLRAVYRPRDFRHGDPVLDAKPLDVYTDPLKEHTPEARPWCSRLYGSPTRAGN